MNLYVKKLPPGGPSLIEQRDAVGPIAQGEEELTPAQVAEYVAECVAASPKKQATRIVLDRLTLAETAALKAAESASPEAWAWIRKAVTEAAISESDPDFPAARQFLDAAGIIAAARWDELLAP